MSCFVAVNLNRSRMRRSLAISKVCADRGRSETIMGILLAHVFARRLDVNANASVLTSDDMDIQLMLTLRRLAEIKSRTFGTLFTRIHGKTIKVRHLKSLGLRKRH